MGPNTNLKKKPVDELPEWMRGAIPVEDEPVEEALPEWMSGAIPVEDEPEAPASKFTEDQINVNYEAPASVRMQVGALPKVEDKLTVLRKSYPDVEPYGEDNFIMTNPENGEVMLYNREGWIPSMGDFASIVPEVAEGVGALGGGVVGGVGGATAGSAVPVVGTAAGGVSGAVAGAGVGGAGARDLAERGINWFFGNEDTRTLGEYAKDKAKDVALNAAGEGAGLALVKGAQVAARPIHKMIAGKADDVAKSTQVAKDLADLGTIASVGTVSQNPVTLAREAAMARANPQGRIAQMGDRLDDTLGEEFTRITHGLAANTGNTLRPSTAQNVGESLTTKADEANKALNTQRDTLYREVDQLTGNVPSSGAKNSSALLQRLNSELKGLGKSDGLNKAPMLKQAIEQTKAVTTDLKAGMTFADAQSVRSTIGKIAFDKSADPFFASRMRDLYKAVSDDMGETAKSVGDDVFKKWREADTFNASLYGKDSPKEAVKGLTKAADGEAAYRFITGKVKEGGTRLANARKEIERVGGAAQWNQMTSTYVIRMGLNAGADGAEVFSPKKFLTEWKKIAPEAKDEMFAGTGRAQYRSDLDRLARITEARQKALGTRTTPMDHGTNLLVGWGSAGLVPAAKAAKNSYMDRLLTNPNVVRWMTGIPQAQMARGGLGEHISVLRNIGREAFKANTPDAQELNNAINQYLNDYGPKDDEKQ
ncbi:hypothetical protein ACQKGL_02165 [Ensifer adhaerens]|uniref:hypothetical protein n=1 Tax=Ensifer adhaerens TaxID=106592 RepID=UPI003CFF9970